MYVSAFAYAHQKSRVVKFFAFGVMAWAATAWADNVTSVTCQSYAGFSSGSTSCSETVPNMGMGGLPAGATATVAQSMEFQAIPADYFRASMFGSTYANCGGELPCYPAISSVIASINMDFVTPGPSRQGYLSVILPTLIDSGANSEASWSYSIAENGGSCYGVQFAYCGGPVRNIPAQPMVFELGTEFNFSEMLSLESDSDTESGFYGTNDATVNLGFRLTELDGDPVSMQYVPEPASWSLMIAPCLLALTWCRARRRRTTVSK